VVTGAKSVKSDLIVGTDDDFPNDLSAS